MGKSGSSCTQPCDAPHVFLAPCALVDPGSNSSDPCELFAALSSTSARSTSESHFTDKSARPPLQLLQKPHLSILPNYNFWISSANMASNGEEQVVNYEDLAALENEFDDAEVETRRHLLSEYSLNAS